MHSVCDFGTGNTYNDTVMFIVRIKNKSNTLLLYLTKTSIETSAIGLAMWLLGRKRGVITSL